MRSWRCCRARRIDAARGAGHPCTRTPGKAMITRSAIIYIATMVAGALILAAAGGIWPSVREGGFMPLFILLALSLLYDVAVMQFGQRFQMSPLSMGQRMT